MWVAIQGGVLCYAMAATLTTTIILKTDFHYAYSTWKFCSILWDSGKAYEYTKLDRS